MLMSEKCRNNNNSDNPLTSRRTDGGKMRFVFSIYLLYKRTYSRVKRAFGIYIFISCKYTGFCLM